MGFLVKSLRLGVSFGLERRQRLRVLIQGDRPQSAVSCRFLQKSSVFCRLSGEELGRSLGNGVRKKGVRNRVRIDDVGSILKFRIGFPFGENSDAFCRCGFRSRY